MFLEIASKSKMHTISNEQLSIGHEMSNAHEIESNHSEKISINLELIFSMVGVVQIEFGFTIYALNRFKRP